MCTTFFSKSVWSSCAQPSPCPKGGKILRKLDIICERYWILKLTPTYIGAAYETTSQNKHTPTQQKILDAWSVRSSYIILTHVIVDNTPYTNRYLYLRKLPSNASQTINILSNCSIHIP